MLAEKHLARSHFVQVTLPLCTYSFNLCNYLLSMSFVLSFYTIFSGISFLLWLCYFYRCYCLSFLYVSLLDKINDNTTNTVHLLTITINFLCSLTEGEKNTIGHFTSSHIRYGQLVLCVCVSFILILLLLFARLFSIFSVVSCCVVDFFSFFFLLLVVTVHSQRINNNNENQLNLFVFQNEHTKINHRKKII